jgi:hypothetical protein
MPADIVPNYLGVPAASPATCLSHSAAAVACVRPASTIDARVAQPAGRLQPRRMGRWAGD